MARLSCHLNKEAARMMQAGVIKLSSLKIIANPAQATDWIFSTTCTYVAVQTNTQP